MKISNKNESLVWKLRHRIIAEGSYEAILSQNGEIIRSQPYQKSSFNYFKQSILFFSETDIQFVSFQYQEISENIFEQQNEISEIEPENKTDLFSPHNFDRLDFYQTCKLVFSKTIKRFQSATRRRTIPAHQS